MENEVLVGGEVEIRVREEWWEEQIEEYISRRTSERSRGGGIGGWSGGRREVEEERMEK